jgi:thiamine-monophosphate kinase
MRNPKTPEFVRIAKAFGWSGDPAKVGDDAAVLPGRQLLCCDALAEGVHFRFDWSTPADVGWKAVAQNVADILAMGGLPTQAVWSVGMGKDWDDSVFAGLAKGAKAACKTYGCEIVGGDTVRTLGAGFVSLSLLGKQHSKLPWTRSGARSGDAVVLVGTPGCSAAGLEALSQKRSQLPGLKALIAVHRRPRPPFATVADMFPLRVHAAIDLSDGLSSEATHLALASKVAIVFHGRKLTIPSALTMAAKSLGKADPAQWLWHGGEDHGLLMCVDPGQIESLPKGAKVVGHVETGAGVWIEMDKTRQKVAPLGWVHR